MPAPTPQPSWLHNLLPAARSVARQYPPRSHWRLWGVGLALLALGVLGVGLGSHLDGRTAAYFAPQQRLAVKGFPNGLALADDDGDGDLDLWVCHSRARQVCRYTNDGRGTFAPAGAWPTGDGSQVCLADLNEDGVLDVVVASYVDARLTWNPGLGHGRWGPTQELWRGANSFDLWAGDLDGDHHTDLLVAHREDSTVLLFGNGRGQFPQHQRLAAGTHALGVLAADVDGDGDPDVLLTSATVEATGHYVRLYRNLGQRRFARVADLPASESPQRLALADVDNDGDLDLLTANTDANSVSLRRNDGTGTYTGTQEVAVGTDPFSVVAADVDGDGDLDLLATNVIDNTVSVRLNDGAGTFSGTTDVPVGASPGTVAAADVDGDGDLDLLTANAISNNVSVRLNNGLGAFSGTGTVAVGSGPVSVALGDVDGDGDLDLLTANVSSDNVSVRLNDGTGNYSGSQDVATGDYSQGMALGDVDGDGDLDFVTADYLANQASVRFNDGSGLFSGTASVATGFAPTAVALADVDADGDLDLLATNYENSLSGSVSVRRNDGAGNFSGTTDVPVGRGPAKLALGDVDGDGDLDFVTANYNNGSATSPSVSVRFNQASAPTISSFNPTSGPAGTTISLTGTNLMGATAITFTGTSGNVVTTGFTVVSSTSITGIVVPAGAATGPLTVTTPGGTSAASAGSFTVTVLLTLNSLSPTRNLRNAPANSSVALTFSAPMSSTTATLGAVKVFSQQRGGRLMNGAGGTTTASGNTLTFNPTTDFRPGETVYTTVTTAAQSSGGQTLAAGKVHQFTAAAGAGPGTFIGTANLAVGSAPYAVVAADGDGDGDLDYLTADYDNNAVSLRRNDGSGGFGSNTAVPAGGNPNGLVAADVDGDGDLDLLVQNGISGISLCRNTGAGTFGSPAALALATSNGLRSLTTGDVDADGDLDLLVVRGEFTGAVDVYANNGTGAFSSRGPVAVDAFPGGVTVADVDGDGDLDLLTSHTDYFFTAGTSVVSVRLNNGSGTFAGSASVGVGVGAYDVVAADVDGDGDLDFVTANASGGGTLSVRLNNGAGTFGGGSDLGLGGTPYALAVGDVDGDGDLDLLAANNNDSEVNVRLNNGSGTFGGGSDVPVGSGSGNVGSGPVSLAVADVDGDGDLDLLTANQDQGAGTMSVRFNQLPPTISGFSPASGPVGQTVTVTGTGLNTATAVTVNGTAGTLTGTPTATGLTFVVGGGSSSGLIVVSTPGGAATSASNFTVLAPPVVTTDAPLLISSDRATLGGDVTGNGGSAVTERGVVYVAGTGTPTVADTKVVMGSGTGPFGQPVPGLAPNTAYTVRAYAINATSTAYGASQPFTTAAALSGSAVVTNVACFGGNTGAINLTPSGGLAPYTFDWGGGIVSEDRTGLTARAYTVTITDDADVTTTVNVTVGGPAAALAATGSQTNVGCFGASTGQAVVNVTGGTAGYTFGWRRTSAPAATLAASSGTASSSTLSGLAAGTYQVTVTDANLCTTTRSFTITAPAAALAISGGSQTNVSTSGGADGTASVTANGGTPGYTYNWTPGNPAGDGTPGVTGLSAGTYTVTVTDANLCVVTRSFTITQPGTVAPVLTAPANGGFTNDPTPTYSGTGPAGSTVAVTVDGTSIGTTTATAGGTWSLVQPTALADGPHTASATATAGGSTSGFSNTNTFTVDTVAPTASLSSTAGASGGSTGTAPIPFALLFSETVTGFSLTDVVLTNGTAGNLAGSGASYTFDVTPTAAGPVTVRLLAGAAQDAAGNNSAAVATYTLTYAPVLPDLTISTGTTAMPVAVAAGAYHNITVTTTGVAQLAGAVAANGAVLVEGSLDTNCQALTGTGSFTLAAGATLLVCDANGLTASGGTGAVRVGGTRSYSTDASYTYNGTVAQATGAGLPATVRNLTIANPTAVTLTAPVAIAQTLALPTTGNLALGGQPLTLLSSASGTALAVNGGTGLVTGGTATVQRYLTTTNPGLGYRHYASPVRGNALADLATATFTPVFDAAYNTRATAHPAAGFPTVFGYDQSRLAAAASPYVGFDRGWFSPTATTPMGTATGYAVNLRGTETVDFTGTLGTGDYARTLPRALGTTGGEGLHLVGNPYPAPIDWNLVTSADRPGVDAAFYVFESSSQYGGSYRSAVNGIGSSSFIGSSQGFFVRVTPGQATGSLTFRNAQRLTDYADQVPVRRGMADLRSLLRLALTGPGGTDDFYLYAQTGATASADAAFDATKLFNPSGLNLGSALATGATLAIDGRADFAAATVVPLAVQVPAAGSYTLTAAALANFAGTRAELVDNLTGTRTVLTPGASYRFATTATTAPGRFWLNLTPAGAPLTTAAAALAAQVRAYPVPTTGRLTVLRPAGAAPAAVLLNALGQTVRTLALPTPETTLDLTGLATGVYTLRLVLDGHIVSKRVVVE